MIAWGSPTTATGIGAVAAVLIIWHLVLSAQKVKSQRNHHNWVADYYRGCVANLEQRIALLEQSLADVEKQLAEHDREQP